MPPAGAVTAAPTAYVANNLSNSVIPIDTATNTTGNPIPVETRPTGIAVTPDGTTAYVADFDSDSVNPIDTATNTPGTPIPLRTHPEIIAITPDGTTAYVVNNGSNSVTPIDTATNTPGIPIPVGNNPDGIAITPNGTTAYVVDNDSNTVTPIDTATNTPAPPSRWELSHGDRHHPPRQDRLRVQHRLGRRDPHQHRHQHRRDPYPGGELAARHLDNPRPGAYRLVHRGSGTGRIPYLFRRLGLGRPLRQHRHVRVELR